MEKILFCNIAWMSHYEGNDGKPDKPYGGGKWVTENGTCGEACNFLACSDGYVYGHVETSQGNRDRKIRIEAIDGSGDYVEGVDVVWTATDPDLRGRRVVGWYRNATVFRERQYFTSFPSRQHRRDEIKDYRIRALVKDMRCLDLDNRTLVMGRGIGWMGHTQWWAPSDKSPPEVRRYVRRVRDLLDGLLISDKKSANRSNLGRNSPSAASDAYLRYVEAYEARITPRRSQLQTRFERFLATDGATEIRPNVASVDLRYCDAEKGTILAEIKPCEHSSARYAIRTAIGQLLDYRQRTSENASLLIVLETKPKEEDRLLAISNGFGIAYPAKSKFEVVWSP